MNIIISKDQFNEEGIYFSEPIKNNIMNEGTFYRIYYSTSSFVLNSIFIIININNILIEKYFNKYKCTFDILTNKDVIEQIKHIEDKILSKIKIINKMPQNKVYEQLKTGNIKIFSEPIEKTTNNFILKISGLWENDNYYGVTYKFIKPIHQ
jgi:ribosomal protein S17E